MNGFEINTRAPLLLSLLLSSSVFGVTFAPRFLDTKTQIRITDRMGKKTVKSLKL